MKPVMSLFVVALAVALPRAAAADELRTTRAASVQAAAPDEPASTRSVWRQDWSRPQLRVSLNVASAGVGPQVGLRYHFLEAAAGRNLGDSGAESYAALRAFLAPSRTFSPYFWGKLGSWERTVSDETSRGSFKSGGFGIEFPLGRYGYGYSELGAAEFQDEKRAKLGTRADFTVGAGFRF